MPDSVLIVGGGPGGLHAARNIADIGGHAILVEQRDVLGGTVDEAQYAALTPHLDSAQDALEVMRDAVTNRPEIELRLGSTVMASEGEIGGFKVSVAKNGGDAEQLDVASVIITTGFQHFDPGRETQMYGYYENPDVITLVDAEKMLSQHKFVRPSNGEVPKRVGFIQCVGSRDRRIGNEYCSKVCCGIAGKEAIEIRKLLPDSEVYIFYIDMRMYGYWENLIYWPAQEEHNVIFVRGVVTEVLKRGDRLLMKGEDTTMGRPMEVEMDVIILSVGMEPSAGTREMARVFDIEKNKYGFIHTPGEPMDPVSTSVPGVYVAGAAAGPKDLEDTIGMASAAAMKALAAVRAHA